MQLTKFFRYAKKVAQIGPRASFEVLKNKVQKKQFYTYWKHRAERGSANHMWEQIVHKQSVSSDFSVFFENLKKRFVALEHGAISVDKRFLNQADLFASKKFDLLGSGLISFEKIHWHQDFRLSKKSVDESCQFDSSQFYQDIVIRSGTSSGLSKDIKVPWELSRFYHAPVLGVAYQKTKQERYVNAFVEQVSDWIESNRFMVGVNWVCPMEVAIRAINWISAFEYFKDEPTIPVSFWERFVCSLYDHFFYLENNWELYDSRTSNHYLSDLVGYFFLTFFFSDFVGAYDKQNWCYRKIIKEFDKQVFQEGTDYEGSTTYHRMVTELFYLFYKVCTRNTIELPKKIHVGLKKMFSFLDWCMINNGEMITIGDNDSGKILYWGINHSLVERQKSKRIEQKKDFQQFGISIIKNKTLHVSLRHHMYNASQPSGHFHNDAGSITLAINGVPIFVDPGSFVYTPSVTLRNRFRSTVVHNSFYLSGHEFVKLDDNLFSLDLPEKGYEKQTEELRLETTHELYNQFGVQANRSICLREKNNILIITDEWFSLTGQKDCLDGLLTEWNFTVHPRIKLVHSCQGWEFFHEDKHLLTMSSEKISFRAVGGLYSPDYGELFATQRLFACADVGVQEPVIIQFLLV